MSYSLTINTDGTGGVTIIEGGEVLNLTDEHPNFAKIVAALVAGDSPARYLSITGGITDDERVTIANGILYFDGEPIHDNLSRTILRYASEGRPTDNLIRFMERLSANPSRRSREQLFTWVSSRNLTIDETGCFIGFKSVAAGAEDGTYLSHSSGTAAVDGVVHHGQIPQKLGSVVTMPREEVQDDPNEGCSEGLHVGTHSYATGWFRGVLLEVRVDPADVVSVPKDASFQKLRCCRYEVVTVHEPEKGDELDGYEPDAEPDDLDDETVEETIAAVVPRSFLSRILGRNKR